MIKYCHSEVALDLAKKMNIVNKLYRLHSSKEHETTYSIEHGVLLNVKNMHGFYFKTDAGKDAIAVVNGSELWRICDHGDHHVHYDVFTRQQVLKIAEEYLTLNSRGLILHTRIKK